jgi:hypothetical protein
VLEVRLPYGKRKNYDGAAINFSPTRHARRQVAFYDINIKE